MEKKLKIISQAKVNSKEDLARVYTPGVAELCKQIAQDESILGELTIAGDTIAVISNGTAVLGLGDIGAKAGLPVMEGKSVLFSELAGVQAYPICINEKDPDKFIEIVKSIALNFSAINLEDISAPSCFYIEDELQKALDIPVMHDDQHGTAIVVLAGLLNAVTLSGKKNLKIVVVGAGAAGSAVTKLIKFADGKDFTIDSLKILDSKGSIAKDRNDLDASKLQLLEISGEEKSQNLYEAIKDADVFIGLSKKDLLTENHVKSMAKNAIIFALANPDPEILPDKAKNAGAFIIATGRSDFPNQINNALAYPGVFKGLLQHKIKKVDIELKYKVSKLIRDYNSQNLGVESLMPSLLDRELPKFIANNLL